MPTGNGKGKKAATASPTGLRFANRRMVVIFDDGREVSVPLHRYPTLERATPAQRSAWRLIGPAKGFHWPALDLDLSVQGLTAGLPELIPSPPHRPAGTRGRRSRALSRS